MVRYLVGLPFLNLTRLRLYRPNNLVAIEQAERVESLFHLRASGKEVSAAFSPSRGNEGGFVWIGSAGAEAEKGRNDRRTGQVG